MNFMKLKPNYVALWALAKVYGRDILIPIYHFIEPGPRIGDCHVEFGAVRHGLIDEGDRFLDSIPGLSRQTEDEGGEGFDARLPGPIDGIAPLLHSQAFVRLVQDLLTP